MIVTKSNEAMKIDFPVHIEPWEEAFNNTDYLHQ
jgi:hypothetical protein